MIVDRLENLAKYAILNPLFPKFIEFMEKTNLNTLEPGKIVLEDDKLIVNVTHAAPKSKEEARLETHNEFIDIQIPLSAEEIMGYTPGKDCLPVDAPYNPDKDITFFEGLADTYLTIKPGMFAVFFPQDGHAPAISPNGVKKVIVKVKS